MSSKHSGASAGVRVQKVEATIEELSRKLKELEQSLDLNEKLLKVGEAFWGPEEIGHGVEEVCVNAQRGDFNYEVCYFGSATQLDGRFRVDLGLSRGLKSRRMGNSQLIMREEISAPTVFAVPLLYIWSVDTAMRPYLWRSLKCVTIP